MIFSHLQGAKKFKVWLNSSSKLNMFSSTYCHDNFFHSICPKKIIRFGFCDIQKNQGLGKGYQPTLTLVILDITKTSSNNYL